MEVVHPRYTFALAAGVVTLACLRLTFLHLLWADEDYHLAAALGILHGRIPYRDFWYDKPPLSAIYYLLIGAFPGIVLRLLDAAYVLLACWMAYRLAKAQWGEAEGRIAAVLLAFFTAFYLPAAVIPFAPDALLLVPHLAAIYFAHQRRGLWAGIFCGLGFCINVKAAFVAAACAVWVYPGLFSFLLGFALPTGLMLGWLALAGALPQYLNQVWIWGLRYAPGAAVAQPFLLDSERIAHWFGFHAALATGAVWALLRSAKEDRLKFAVWIALSFTAVCLGNHFAPRYFLQLLPPLVILGARGIHLAMQSHRKLPIPALTIMLLVPLIRFGPRYAWIAADRPWSDIALDLDSRQAASTILRLAHAGDTLFVWGYRPDVYVYTRLLPPGPYWDSQPLTGIPADRHLIPGSYPVPKWAAANWKVQGASHPTFVVDGLGPLNAQFDLATYGSAKEWMRSYAPIARTKLCIIYRRIDGEAGPAK